jgi:glycosyltransferase involved in cell wall biosynthesis
VSRKKIAIITNIPVPYRRDLFIRLSGWKEFTSKVFFTSNAERRGLCDDDDTLDYPHIFLPGWRIKRKDGLETYINLSILYHLRRYSPEIIIIGGASIPTLFSIVYKKLFACRVVIWWAGTCLSEARRGGIVRIFRKWLFARADGFLTYGNLSEQYLHSLSARLGPITSIGNNTLDSERYGCEARQYIDQHLRKVSSEFTLLVVSQLIGRKNVMFLLETFSALSRKYPNVMLRIAGTGPEETSLRTYCTENSLKNVHFLGHVQAKELTKHYAQADVLVSVARMDQWPQVVNEAMSCGVPVIASTTSGIDTYFLRDGINGYLVDPEDKETLLDRLEYLVLNPEKARLMGQEAFHVARTYDVHYAIGRIEEVLLNENPSCP